GVCYVWTENAERENGGIQQQWGQRISAAGERLWGDRGRAIQARNVDASSITTDGNGGVITVVEYNPTVQMINRNGEIGVVLENSVDDKIGKQKSSQQSRQLFLYPNPGNSQFRIKYDIGIPGEMFSYGIYNLMGRKLMTGKLMGNHLIVNDLSRFSSGEYILRFQSPRTTVSTRFLLIK
ncbi:MAG: T9SS type A sorting domain-containing protein, partial [Candidatus Hatepunaea meridiana]|nr:T9SS type A sorting domain-containing protein [Candidatus Hatepunaea meridiana]